MSVIPSYHGIDPYFHMCHYDFDPWEMRLGRLMDRDNFGLGISPAEIRSLQRFGHVPKLEKELQHTTIGENGLEAHIDTRHFKPSEITVKSVGNTIIVEGKHDERKDKDSHVTRHFTRKYVLPDDYDTNDVISHLSSDGILTVKAPAPKEAIEGKPKEKILPVHQTGPAHLHIK